MKACIFFIFIVFYVLNISFCLAQTSVLKVDGSSSKAFESSTKMIEETLPPDEKEAFERALSYIFEAGFVLFEKDMEKKGTKLTASDNALQLAGEFILSYTHGKTPAEIIVMGTEAKRAKLHAEIDDVNKRISSYKEKMEKEKDLFENVDEKMNIKNLEFSIDNKKNVMKIDFDIKNNFSESFKKIDFIGKFVSTGRKISWFENKLQHKFSKPLAPGEEQHITCEFIWNKVVDTDEFMQVDPIGKYRANYHVALASLEDSEGNIYKPVTKDDIDYIKGRERFKSEIQDLLDALNRGEYLSFFKNKYNKPPFKESDIEELKKEKEKNINDQKYYFKILSDMQVFVSKVPEKVYVNDTLLEEMIYLSFMIKNTSKETLKKITLEGSLIGSDGIGSKIVYYFDKKFFGGIEPEETRQIKIFGRPSYKKDKDVEDELGILKERSSPLPIYFFSEKISTQYFYEKPRFIADASIMSKGDGFLVLIATMENSDGKMLVSNFSAKDSHLFSLRETK